MAAGRLPRVAVIGAGSWGTTVAALVAENRPTMIWARHREIAEEIEQNRTNERYLPDARLPAELSATHSLEEAAAWADIVVMAVPSHGFRAVLEQAAPPVRPWGAGGG